MFVTNLLSLTLNLSSLPLSCVESSLPLCFVESDTNGSLPVLALAGAAIYVCNEPPKPYPEPVLVASQFRRILFSSQFRRIRHQRIAPCPRAGRGRYMFVTNLLSLTLNLSSLPLSFVESSLPLSFVESDTNGSLPAVRRQGPLYVCNEPPKPYPKPCPLCLSVSSNPLCLSVSSNPTPTDRSLSSRRPGPL